MFTMGLVVAYNFLIESVINDGNICFYFLLVFWMNIVRMENLTPDV